LFLIFLFAFFWVFGVVFRPAKSSETPISKGVIKKREKEGKDGVKAYK
jgi:hypothetical protein